MAANALPTSRPRGGNVHRTRMLGAGPTPIRGGQRLARRVGRRWRRASITTLCLIAFVAGISPARAVELTDAQKLFKTGKYAECIDTCAQAIDARQWGEGWWVLKLRSELATGQYAQALKTQEAG